MHPDEVHLTVAVVVYRTQDGTGPLHYGVCSNYLQDVPIGNDVYVFVRRFCLQTHFKLILNEFILSAPNFYLPSDSTKPVVLVGPGTGIAPFRAFWQERYMQLKNNVKIGRMWLFFGCRTKDMDLYKEEKALMLKTGVLERVFLALSREPNIPKVLLWFFFVKIDKFKLFCS